VPGFEVVSELGRGGMGVVYKATQIGLNRIVALKMLIAGPFANPALRARFLLEAESVAALEHPGIVRVFAFGEHQGRPYLAMEFLPGGTLAERIEQSGPLPAKDATELMTKLAGAVAHAHSRGVVHRDIKPLNVLLTAEGEPRLTDFGLAKVGRADQNLSVTGQVLGTPAYMAPEQAAGKVREVGTAADVYALGAVLYEVLTGRPPFTGDSAAVTLQKVLTEEPERPRKLNPSIPHDLETICLKCLEKEPAKRYPTAQALADDLARYSRNEPISVRPAGALERGQKWVKRNKVVAGLWAVIVALSAVGVASVWAGSPAALLVVLALVWLGTLLLFLKRQSQLRDAEPDQFRLPLRFRGRVVLGGLVGAVLVPAYIGFANSDMYPFTGSDRGTAGRILVLVTVGGVLGALVGGMTAASRSVSALVSNQGWWQGLLVALPLVLIGGHWSGFRAALSVLPAVALGVLVAFAVGAVLQWQAGKGRVPVVAGLLHLCVTTVCVVSLLWWPLFFAGELGLLLGGGLGWTVGALIGCVFGPLILGALLLSTPRQTETNSTPPKWTQRLALRRRPELLAMSAVLAGMAATPFWLDWRDGAPAVQQPGDTPGNTITVVALSPDGAALSGDLFGDVRLQRAPGEVATDLGQPVEELKKKLEELKRKNAEYGKRLDELGRKGGRARKSESEQIKTEAEQLEKELGQLEKEQSRLTQFGGRVVGAAFSPDGKLARATRQDGSLIVWDVATGREVRRFTGLGLIGCAAFAPDGRTVVTGGAWPTFYHPRIAPFGRPAGASKSTSAPHPVDPVARLWDTESGQLVRVFEGHKGPVRAVAFGPTGRQVLTASDDGTMRLWDVASGLEVRRLKGYDSRALCVAVSPDGSRALSGHLDGSARVWDLEALEEVRRFERHRGGVTAVAFGSDGRTAFSGSLDGTVRRWEAATGRQLGICRSKTWVYALVVSRDDLAVLVGSLSSAERWSWSDPIGR
jgi:WD40 repeat protein/tRNA A-37 threonylcarbamoyl transferase component Bud32